MPGSWVVSGARQTARVINALGAALAGWTLHWAELPVGIHGLTDYARRRIIVDRRLSPASKRRVLDHECWHARRGAPDPDLVDHEEETINQLVARKLIPIRALAEVLLWSSDDRETAAALGVDLAALWARFRGLHPSELALLVRLTGWRGGGGEAWWEHEE